MGETGDGADVEGNPSTAFEWTAEESRADEAPPELEEAAVIVPVDALSEQALHGLIEEFATRDGTDYGDVERSLESKVEELRAQIERGEIVIVFDQESQRTQLVATG